MTLSLQRHLEAVDRISPVEKRGRVTEVVGMLVRAIVPGARIGEVCLIRAAPDSPAELAAEVVGFRGGQALLVPLGESRGLALGAQVLPTRSPFALPASHHLLGRVLSGLAQPRDGLPPLPHLAAQWRPASAPPPDPLTRRRISRPLWTGIRAIDALLTLGEGQRVGLFAPAGAGKSTLLGMLARGCQADVTVVALVGERGREVRDFLEGELGDEARGRAVVVVATSDEPAVARIKAAQVATAAAEYFRDEGYRVLLLVDSLTRYARALREVGLAAGEPPARQGYPPSVFAELPRLLERAGNSERGSVTAFYTVLVEGDDLTEVVADEARSLLDGHIILSRRLAGEGHYPAVEVLGSVSRVMGAVTGKEQMAAAGRLRGALAAYDAHRELLAVGAYKRGSNLAADAAISQIEEINAFLRQRADEKNTPPETLARLFALFPPPPAC